MADYDDADRSPRPVDDAPVSNGENGNDVDRSPRGREGEDTMMDRERSPAYRQDRDDDDDGRDRRGGRDDRDGRGDRERSPRRRPPPPPPGRDREAQVSNVLGCFGLSIRTRDIDLEDEFNRYGHVEKAVIVYDQRSERSRGFGFVTMRTEEEAARCIEKLNGIELHGRNIRVAYSLTQKPHAATPGEYMGFKSDHAPPPPRRYEDRRYDDRRGGPGGYGGGGYGGGGGGYHQERRYDDRRDDRRGGGGYDDRDRYSRGGPSGGGRERDYDDRRGGGAPRRYDDRYADTAAAPMAAAYDDRDRYASSRRDDSPPPRRTDYRSSRY